MCCWVAIAQRSAVREDGNASMKPSPWFFTTVPPNSDVHSSITSLCACSTWSHRSSPRKPFRVVESSMSVNAIVTVPSGADVTTGRGAPS